MIGNQKITSGPGENGSPLTHNAKEDCSQILMFQEVSLVRSTKYLGFSLDAKGTLTEHLDYVTTKAEKTSKLLAGLMSNNGGDTQSKRKILGSVNNCMILYVAPVWCKVVRNQGLTSINCLINIRIACAYRTISTKAIGIRSY